MPRPELQVLGPERVTLSDIEAVNRLFSDAFTERYHRDGMTGVRVPFLTREVWRYAIEDAGEGAMLWRDLDGQLASFNMAHLSGQEGWMGPLAVRPGLQGSGLGARMVRAAIAWLRRRGATVIGLETMPRTVDNIGFYSGIGFVPGHLTVSVVKDLDPERAIAGPGERLSRAADAAALAAACRRLTARVASWADYSREITLTQEMRLGDTTVVRDGDQVEAFALWHSAALAQGRPSDEIRVLKVVARDLAGFRSALRATERFGLESGGIARVAVRCQTAFPEAYAALLEDGYRVHWTDLRMTLQGAGEVVQAPGLIMSNWEI